MRSLLALACLALASCSSSSESPAPDGGLDAGLEDAGAGDAAPCTLASPYSTKNPACNGCAEQRCCAEVNGCLLATACNDDYVNCLLACAFDPDAGQDPCQADCAAQYPAGKAAYDTAIGCVDQACATECGP
jgi:hypothetical protein